MNQLHLRELAYVLAQVPEAREFTRMLDACIAAQSMDRCVRLQEETLDDLNEQANANEPLDVSYPNEP